MFVKPGSLIRSTYNRSVMPNGTWLVTNTYCDKTTAVYMVKRRSTCSTSANQSDVASRRHLRSADRRLLHVSHQRRSTFARRAFSVAGPLVWNSLPDYLRDPAVSRDKFLRAPKDLFVCSVLIYVQRIRGFTTMRDINLRFIYLLTYLLQRKIAC